MPQFTGVSVDLIDRLLAHLKVSLPVSWSPISNQEGVCAVLLSSELTAVQRNVFVYYEQGSVRIHVHGKPLPEDHVMWDKIGPNFPLCKDNVQAFSSRIVRIVTAVCQLKICPGIEATEGSAKYFRSKKWVTFEENIFGGLYVPCYRPYYCDLLISLQQKRCVSCSTFARNFYRRAASLGLTSNQNSDETALKVDAEILHDYFTKCF